MAFILLIALALGVFMYAFLDNTKAARVGEILMFCSILAFLIAVAPLTVRWLGH